MSAPEFDIIDTLVRLAQVPTAVPLGSRTLIEPDDPILVDYVQNVLRPEFVAVGATDIIDIPGNQFAVRFGNGNGPCLVLMAYTPTQHHNLMDAPWSGDVREAPELGVDAPAVFGQGVTQNKVHQAVLVDLARRLIEEQVEIDGSLLLCINNEGRSSHECSLAILDTLETLGQRPDLAIQLFCTDFAITVGNRGRADIYLDLTGTATHSSTPPANGRVIDAVADIISHLRILNAKAARNTHPVLGHEQVVPYLVDYQPLAPHTLPSSARITIDRRLLPGTSAQAARDDIEQALSAVDLHGCTATVTIGPVMLPALLEPHQRAVLAPLEDAVRSRIGRVVQTIYPGTFDAGGPSSRGVPTVMFGVADEGDLLGDDFVRVSAVHEESAVVHEAVLRFFGLPKGNPQ